MRALVVSLFFMLCGMQPSSAQPLPLQSTPPQPSGFQARIDAAALMFRDSDPRLKRASPEYLQGLAEFVIGNMLFVLLHELGHVAISQMGLPVLGKIEDAADTFATLMLLRVGSDFSHGVLADAAEGWFLAHRRDQKTGDEVAFYDEHGLNQQRAYHIVCLMVGSDAEKFKELADEAKLPRRRQDSCAADYSNAVYSWDLLLKPHRRPPDQPKTNIAVVYGPAQGKAAVARQVARSVRLLETVAERAADEFVWRSPFTLEMKSCGFPNARWHFPSRTLTLCYELATDFAHLYREYGNTQAKGTRLAHSAKQTTGHSTMSKASSQSNHRRRRPRHRAKTPWA
jgi:Putative metallopeptidase